MRKLFLIGWVMLIATLYIGRLFYLQVVKDDYADLSQSNAVKVKYEYPQRGYIYDRNGKLLVANQPSYDIMVVPRNVKAFDTIAFAKLLDITPKRLKKEMKRARKWSPFRPSVLVPQLTKNEYAELQTRMRHFPGFYIQKRNLRDYQMAHAANVLGYVGEANERVIKNNPYYNLGDILGINGVEKTYEDTLRGVKGVQYIQKDKLNRDIGPFKKGALDTIAVPGSDIALTLDIDLQAYGEQLMVNKRGGIVAIEPSTGEILALVTAPTYDPADLVGRKRSPNFSRMYRDTIAKPLYDRGLLAQYPPGSPFKTLNALIALEEGVMSTTERVSCHGGLNYGGKKKLGCHHHKSPVNMISGIALSCNAYFGTAYRRIIEDAENSHIGMQRWSDHLESFGIGRYLGTDLATGKAGRLPDSTYYNKWYPRGNWYATTTISNSIGQGEILMTPMHLANMTAAIANRGYFYTPHIIKEVNGVPISNPAFTERRVTTIKPENFEPVVQGMHDVYNYGTASFLRVPDIEICGKTGTAENFTKINGERKQLTDHSIFVAFAPKDDPKIAIAIFVEHGYWGARWAGRMASVMIEKYLKGEVTRTDLERYVLNGSLEEEYAKPLSGEPFKINQ